jgi:hypothetical protein
MLDFLLNLEQSLPILLEQYGVWIYAILFLVIFAETAIEETLVQLRNRLRTAAREEIDYILQKR